MMQFHARVVWVRPSVMVLAKIWASCLGVLVESLSKEIIVEGMFIWWWPSRRCPFSLLMTIN